MNIFQSKNLIDILILIFILYSLILLGLQQLNLENSLQMIRINC